MQVALQAPPLFILGRHQALPGCPQLLQTTLQVGGQAHVLQHQARLVGEVGDQLLLDRSERFPAAFHQGQHSENLVLVADWDRSAGVGDIREDTVADRNWLVSDNRVRVSRRRVQVVCAAQPDGRRLRPCPLLEHLRHPPQHISPGVGLGDAPGKLGQYLVRRRSLAIDKAVGHLLDPLSDRLESNRHDRRSQDRKDQVGPAAAPHKGADAHHDSDINGRNKGGESPVNQGPADDDVDVIQPVPEHRDADTHRQRGEPDCRREEAVRREGSGDRDDHSDHRHRGCGDKPLELVAQGGVGPSITNGQRRHCCDHQRHRDCGPHRPSKQSRDVMASWQAEGIRDVAVSVADRGRIKA
ncbi:MAG: hypothetical protein WBD38_01540 [Candidatus Dormiibacterota bacterium]